ncbi:MarR family winged helix-turn-helix transcriptional regulator [Nocardia wallacei]|uniref:MarR family winged helix-turn-helix transcriptional regulator n=1 Tax=Nocardia wallacei TaxID=480035 RepID=UPI00245530F1|nr:MarR family transcriptional regulator [Nocardia wallacei]
MEDLEDQPLGYLLYRVVAALRAEVVATVLQPRGLSFPGYLCLRLLSQAPGSSNAQLARVTGVSPQAMNKVLRDLQQSGLVARPATAPAGRSLPASLTPEGARTLSRMEPEIAESERRALAGLTEQGRRELRRLLASADGTGPIPGAFRP